MTPASIQDLKIVLCDPTTDVLEAWRAQFDERHPQIEIVEGDPVSASTDGLVCPGNGFGFMDSGLPLRVCETLGWDLQDRVREGIASGHDEELFVGQALVVETGGTPARLIYAPIMRTALTPESVAIYLATRAVLLAVDRHITSADGRIDSVTFPGLGVEEGGFHPVIAARQLRYAYEEVIGIRKVERNNLSQVMRRERKLWTMPRSTES